MNSFADLCFTTSLETWTWVGTLRCRHSQHIFNGKWKTTTHESAWQLELNLILKLFYNWVQSWSIVITLSVVSIDYSFFIFSYRFGLAVLFLCSDRRVPVQLCAYCALWMLYPTWNRRQFSPGSPHTENGVPAVAVVVTLVLNESKCLESKGKWKDSLKNGKISHFGSA